MSKLYVGIVFGGISLEYNVSLRSAENIASVIDRDRFSVIMIRVDKNGMWYRNRFDSKVIFSNSFRDVFLNIFRYFKTRFNKNKLESELCTLSQFSNLFDVFANIDVVFPIIHGRLGEDGALQGLLKIQQIPFVGTGILGSAVSMDKDVSKRLLCSAGLMVAPFITLTDSNVNLDFEYYADVLGIPFFVKPTNQGSSIGVSKVTDYKSFYSAVNLAFSLDKKILLESAIIGRELECAVLGNKYPKVSVFGEIVLDQHTSFYTYKNKYAACEQAVKIVIPAKVPREISDDIYDVVLHAFRILHCWGMARIDFFLTSDYRIIINEVNTLPGFTITSMYPKLWEASGLSCKELISILIELALECREED